MQFTPIQPPDLLRQIIAQIKQNIASGALRKGDRLPSERDLSAAFGISRPTLREALKNLEMLGVVECLHGSGYYISANPCSAIAEPLGIMMQIEGGSIMHTHQLRRAIEQEGAALAAAHATEDDIAAMEALIKRIPVERDEQTKAALDRQFHYAIAQASGNPLLTTLLSACESLIDEHIQGARLRIIQNDANEARIDGQHEAILSAIRRGDSLGAADAVGEHMALIAQMLLAQQND